MHTCKLAHLLIHNVFISACHIMYLLYCRIHFSVNPPVISAPIFSSCSCTLHFCLSLYTMNCSNVSGNLLLHLLLVCGKKKEKKSEQIEEMQRLWLGLHIIPSHCDNMLNVYEIAQTWKQVFFVISDTVWYADGNS